MTTNRAIVVESEASMVSLGKDFARNLQRGDVVLMYGELGAGKTTLARGILQGKGWQGSVRSPSYSLIIEYPTEPPIVHVDLYRLESVQGIGLEDYGDEHICLIEWAERLGTEFQLTKCIRVNIAVEGTARKVQISEPETR